MSKIQVGAKPGAGGGTGTSSALSGKKLAFVGRVGSAQVITAATEDTQYVSLTGATITKGADYWGVPDSALDLDVTIDGSGHLVLPDEDATYDVLVTMQLGCDVADANKWVGILVNADDGKGYDWSPIYGVDHACVFYVNCTARIFKGDGPSNMTISLNAVRLTVDAIVQAVHVTVVER